ncbi:MAG: restriction endonuclease subunit S [Ectothiorhodospiraceae bacterium AqS1]|nr:restriction endonuclease subunit S [Ectothiorhodospiraceae bacterium AqS1]
MDAPVVPLEGCCTLWTGVLVHREDFDENGEIGVVQIRDIDAEGRLLTPLDRVRLGSGVSERQFLRDGDVLLKGRGSRMTAAHIEKAPAGTIATSAYFVLRAKSNVLPGFLAWYLNNARLPVMQSMTMKLLHLKDLRGVPVHLPEIEVQQQVIDAHRLIEEARRLSDRYHRRIGQLLRGAVFNSAVNRVGGRQA